MNCPICDKETKIMCCTETHPLPDDREIVEVIGRCEDCDFDATWWIGTSPSNIREYDFRQYCFG